MVPAAASSTCYRACIIARVEQSSSFHGTYGAGCSDASKQEQLVQRLAGCGSGSGAGSGSGSGFGMGS